MSLERLCPHSHWNRGSAVARRRRAPAELLSHSKPASPIAGPRGCWGHGQQFLTFCLSLSRGTHSLSFRTLGVMRWVRAPFERGQCQGPVPVQGTGLGPCWHCAHPGSDRSFPTAARAAPGEHTCQPVCGLAVMPSALGAFPPAGWEARPVPESRDLF